jgi:transposase-like protein
MAQRTQLDDTNNLLHEAYACLLANGLDGAGEALRILVNEASRIERAQHLQATPYERCAERVDYANGYKSKTVLTRLGELTFEVPQVRSGGFYPSALERGSRSEQAMNLALAEMYVQGVSTRKVITVLQKLVGPEIAISSTQISRCTALLDEGLNAWRTRPLDETPYVILDARYERVRHANQVVDCAVLVAIGITTTGQRRVLGVSVALSEAEVHWRAFLDSLIGRGLRGVKYIASDDHAGLKAARKAMFPGVPWQRCQFHLQHNAQGYVTKLDQRTTVARQIRAIFNAGDAHEAQRLLNVACSCRPRFDQLVGVVPILL